MTIEIRTGTRARCLLAAAAMASVVSVPSVAAAEGMDGSGAWQAHLLALPSGYPDARGYVTGTDGRGGYSGALGIDGTLKIVTWNRGKAVIRGVPDGFEFAAAWDQNRSGTVVGEAIDYESNTSQAFVLDRAEFTMLPTPAGFASTQVVAINNDGDVLGSAFSDEGTESVIVVWRGESRHPVTIRVDLAGAIPADLDEDGTILLNTDQGPYLWKDGVASVLHLPAGYDSAQAESIRSGRAVGHASSPDVPTGHAFLWTAPDSPRRLPGGATASEISVFGLIVGREPDPISHVGPLTTWLGTYTAGRLPMPAGYVNGAAGVVGDDGTIAGVVSNDPLDEGGRPTIWTFSAPTDARSR